MAPGFSPLGDAAEAKRQAKLVSEKQHQNFIIGVANDTVWSGNREMHKGHANVKILKPLNTDLSGSHNNHFLKAFKQPAGGLKRFRPDNYFHADPKKNFTAA